MWSKQKASAITFFRYKKLFEWQCLNSLVIRLTISLDVFYFDVPQTKYMYVIHVFLKQL